MAHDAEAFKQYVQHLQITPITVGLRRGGQPLSEKSIRNKGGLLLQILRSAKARWLILTNLIIDLDWKELLWEKIYTIGDIGTFPYFWQRHRHKVADDVIKATQD